MPYDIKNPPDQIKMLPKHGMEIWIAAFNSAFEQYKNDEGKAAATAWAAVGEKYEKDDKGVWRAKGDLAFCEIHRRINEALQARYGKETWISEAYPSYIIYQVDGENYKLSYSILDDVITLGETPVKVEKKWLEIRSGQAESDEGIDILMRLGEALNPEGTEWDVTICQPGVTKNGWFLPEDVLRAGASLFENVDVNLYELPQGATHVPDPLFDIKSLLVKNKVGWIDKVRYVAGEGMKGVLHFLDSAKWLGKNLLDAVKKGASIYGLSYDAPVRAVKDMVDGKDVVRLVKFLKADSVDIVTRPAAGGKFNRAVASAPAHNEEVIMKKKFWDLIQEKRPDLLKGKDFEKFSDQEVEALARMAMEPIQPSVSPENDQVKLLRCEMSLERKLTASDLPDLSKERIRKTYGGKVFEDGDVDRAIADEKDYLAKITVPPEPDPVAASRITGGLGSLERAQMAVDRMFGLTKDAMLAFSRMETIDHEPFFRDMRSVQDYNDFDQVPMFSSLREMYTFFTGDPTVSGQFNRSRLPKEFRSRMDITSSTFTYVLGNTLGRRLVSEYREANFGEDLLISFRKNVKDFRLQEAVLVGGFADSDTVDPEVANYQEVAPVSDEESTYTVTTRGNIMTITRKTIINDDLSIVQRLVSKRGRAIRRTHAKYVWAFWKDNATCSDGTAWFTGGHGNLGSTAMSFAQALIAYIALGKMTEKDSGERLGLLSDFAVKPTLIYPIDLMAMGDTIVNDDFYYTGAADLTTKTRNSLKGKVNGYCCPLLTDTTDWGLLMPNNVMDIVEMGYLNGRQEPEMFVADSPQSEQVFVGDKVRYKDRFEYAGAVIDYRSGYKEEV